MMSMIRVLRININSSQKYLLNMRTLQTTACAPPLGYTQNNMKVIRTLRSSVTPCTNFLIDYKGGVIEARYVRKADNYVALYVSSHNGCSMGCNFCHLTQNGDTKMNHVDIATYEGQMRMVLDHYRQERDAGRCVVAERCNINFMSKGDAMANKYVVNQYPKMWEMMDRVCREYGLDAKPNISTIMPNTVKNHKLIDIFGDSPVWLYYSLYSMNPVFRKRWLPNAMPAEEALDKLKAYQEQKNRVITFHFTLIKGHNDNMADIYRMAEELRQRNFNGKLNLVRFNPHPSVSDVESDPHKINEIFDILSSIFNNPKSYIVPRLDVNTKTPCGMFVPLNQI